MDKHKVIEAYRRGLITLQECGQILGQIRRSWMICSEWITPANRWVPIPF
ncbi:hypothetical protein [Brevibacillus choshinensis]|uniref:Uncharacterized protein n=1 Tax=Brevibacillus choshinensis TaxID=54911 RepID=A0ABX7FYK6_BRECH|nr:hypothetical protein [Brevibacillus choshinensis]QRG70868.1 hypothetical protein JNE38_12780 [Brevibacillus choshinensis]